jgi:lipase chaperone LimK
MHKKKIITVTVIIVFLTIIIIILNHFLRKDTGQEFVSDENYRAQLLKSELSNGWKNISNEDMRKYLANDKDFNKQKVKDQFSSAVVNHDTLNFFQYMDALFKDSKDLTDNMEKARKYLYSVLPPQQANQMLDLYKTYVNYQIDLQPKLMEFAKAGTPDEALANLSRLQEHRRAVFGKEIADIIFGPSEKAEEYSLRRQMIISDNNMYGLEKERRLHILNEAMWGSETMPFDENLTPHARYQEKLMLYQKDLSKERPEAERAATLEQFRREIFTPEQLQGMEEVDRSLAEEKKNEEQYFAQEKEIMNDQSLDQEGKESKIRDLQDKMFGEEADAFRRAQIMQKTEEQYVKARVLKLEQAKSRPFDEEALREQARKILEQQNASEQEENSAQSKNKTVN